ncbi:MAG: hypothetical protein CLLPBCKN_006643 [Chroococcidiopsis cubana SAG 39.79]|nr:hypothetical protein [Chroococcidiopsis cubana SAG 39.79]
MMHGLEKGSGEYSEACHYNWGYRLAQMSKCDRVRL